MKKLCLLSLLLSSISAFALPLVYEPFDYPLTPTNLIGKVNPDGFTWYQAGPTTGMTNVPAIEPGNLSYTGLAPSTGKSVKFGGIDSGGMAARFSRASGALATTGTIYYSFLIKITDITGLSTAGVFWAGFNNSAGSQAAVPSQVATRILTRASGAGFNIGLDKTSGSPIAFQWATNVYNLGETLFIVGSYTFNTGSTTDDVAQMWINPDPANFGAASAPTTNVLVSMATNDIGSAQINSFCLFNRNAAQPRGIILDELSIGTTWADVTPSTAAIAITSQPQDQRVAEGNQATFTVNTYRALTFQWQHDEANISDATNATLVVTDAKLSDAGNYRVLVGNGITTLTSSNALLSVFADVYPRLTPLWSIPPWSRPYMSTDTTQLPNQRHFAYNALSNQVLLVSRTNTSTLSSNAAIYVIDATTGADLYQMTVDATVTGGGIALSSIDVSGDGSVYGANISSSTASFRLYRWENSGASTAPANVYDGYPWGIGTERFGDSLAARNSGAATEVLLVDSTGQMGAIMTPTDGTLTAFFANAFTNTAAGAVGGRTLVFDSGATFWEKHRASGLKQVSYNLPGFNSTLVTNYNNFPSSLGVSGFNFGLNLLCGVNSVDSATAPDTLDLYDIANPAQPVFLASYNFPTNSQPNANRCGRVIFAGERVYALDSNNGLMAFNVSPRLLLSTSGSDLVLSWPASLTGYMLEASYSLLTPSWTNVSSGTLVGSYLYVTNPISSGNLFYRLKK